MERGGVSYQVSFFKLPIATLIGNSSRSFFDRLSEKNLTIYSLDICDEELNFFGSPQHVTEILIHFFQLCLTTQK